MTTAATMTGSPKQIEWAERIRTKRIEEAGRIFADGMRAAEAAGQGEVFGRLRDRVLADLAARTDASWWIDTQHMWVKKLINEHGIYTAALTAEGIEQA